jgi:hypothetical protein
MTESGKNKDHFTAEDIRRYLEGNMSPAEMHRLEKAALHDPFLADAIEGIQFTPADAFKKNVEELKDSLSKKVRPHRTLKGMWWKAAAVILLIASGVAITLTLNEDKETAQLSKKENIQEQTDSQSVTPAVPLKPDSAIAFKDMAVVVSPPVGQSRKSTVAEQDNAKVMQEQKPGETIMRAETDATQNEVVEDTPTAGKEEAAVANANQRALQGKAAGVTTGKEPERLSDSTGELSEVVVTGYGIKKTRVTKKERIVPKGGWDAFQEYISTNKKITTADSVKHGSQVVIFTIDDAGIVEDIRMQKSLSPAHDSETIRLLVEGPAWEVNYGKKRKLKLTILF